MVWKLHVNKAIKNKNQPSRFQSACSILMVSGAWKLGFPETRAGPLSSKWAGRGSGLSASGLSGDPSFESSLQICLLTSFWASSSFSWASVLVLTLRTSRGFEKRGNGYLLQYSCPENPWTEEPGTVVHGVTRVGHDWVTERAHTHRSLEKRGGL